MRLIKFPYSLFESKIGEEDPGKQAVYSLRLLNVTSFSSATEVQSINRGTVEKGNHKVSMYISKGLRGSWLTRMVSIFLEVI